MVRVLVIVPTALAERLIIAILPRRLPPFPQNIPPRFILPETLAPQTPTVIDSIHRRRVDRLQYIPRDSLALEADQISPDPLSAVRAAAAALIRLDLGQDPDMPKLVRGLHLPRDDIGLESPDDGPLGIIRVPRVWANVVSGLDRGRGVVCGEGLVGAGDADGCEGWCAAELSDEVGG